MNGRRIIAVASKEIREVARDKLFAVLAFVLPSFLMLLLGVCLSMDVENIPIAIVDNDNTPESRDFTSRFSSSRYFNLVSIAYDDRELDPLLKNNVIRAVIIIPAHFGKNINKGRPAPIQTLLDGTYTSRAQITKGYISSIIASMNGNLLAQYISRIKGIPLDRAQIAVRPVSVDSRYLYNPSIKSVLGLAPRLLVLILYMVPPLLTGLGVVREKETGSIFNVYASTLTRGEYLIGKLIPYVGIAFLNAIVLLLIALLVFGAPFKGSMLFFLVSTLAYVVSTCCLGLMISTLMTTQAAAMIFTAIVTQITAVNFSGVMVPVGSLSPGGQKIAHLFPCMFYTRIIEGTFLKGTGTAQLWLNVLILVIFSIVLFTISYLQFHKRTNA
ncbi:MAG: ABC transporter permease [Armatimonadota bacterium]|nr:ABC transporter permease [bacterium]